MQVETTLLAIVVLVLLTFSVLARHKVRTTTRQFSSTSSFRTSCTTKTKLPLLRSQIRKHNLSRSKFSKTKKNTNRFIKSRLI